MVNGTFKFRRSVVYAIVFIALYLVGLWIFLSTTMFEASDDEFFQSRCSTLNERQLDALAVPVTFVMATYLLSQAQVAHTVLCHYQAYSFAEFIVVWNNPQVPPPLYILPPGDNRYRIVRTSENSLNHRYNPKLLNIKTDIIYVVDDDYIIDDNRSVNVQLLAHDLDRKRLIGCEPRAYYPGLGYRLAKLVSLNRKEFQLTLPPYVVSKQIMHYYWSSEMAVARRYVDAQVAHCDDILINLLYLKLYGKPPWTVQCKKTDLDETNSMHNSKAVDRKRARTECTNWLVKELEVLVHLNGSYIDISQGTRELRVLYT